MFSTFYIDVYIIIYVRIYYSFVHGEFTLYPSLLRLANVFEKYTVFFSRRLMYYYYCRQSVSA